MLARQLPTLPNRRTTKCRPASLNTQSKIARIGGNCFTEEFHDLPEEDPTCFAPRAELAISQALQRYCYNAINHIFNAVDVESKRQDGQGIILKETDLVCIQTGTIRQSVRAFDEVGHRLEISRGRSRPILHFVPRSDYSVLICVQKGSKTPHRSIKPFVHTPTFTNMMTSPQEVTLTRNGERKCSGRPERMRSRSDYAVLICVQKGPKTPHRSITSCSPVGTSLVQDTFGHNTEH